MMEESRDKGESNRWQDTSSNPGTQAAMDISVYSLLLASLYFFSAFSQETWGHVLWGKVEKGRASWGEKGEETRLQVTNPAKPGMGK